MFMALSFGRPGTKIAGEKSSPAVFIGVHLWLNFFVVSLVFVELW
jgi:hypothetical protein